MLCICCGNDTRQLFPVPAHIGNLRACGPCISKHGLENIAAEADRLLTEWFLGQLPEPVCGVCGDPVIVYPDGSHPMWCQKCEAKRKAYVNAHAR